ncbi:hypothetical protein BJY04DRAFT_136309 [Aspergillus karnatakaensis]|uniref:uncharacterized protein n=1 Tax=Aspergillus karnatakaensis TaxID=1810916 RepID=UPI003CCCFACD
MLTESSSFHHMKNPLKIMTAIVQKLRRKRKLSSELDSRWGDMAISSPNEGSWSQYDASSVRGSPVSDRSSENGHSNDWKPSAGESSAPFTLSVKRNESRKATGDSFNMPTGYYDSKVRRHSKSTTRSSKAQPVQPQPITLPKAWEDKKHGDSSADEAEDNVSALGSPQARRGTEEPNPRGSKSPPLSVTSRMRRFSGQSTATDPIFSVPGTASSHRTSFSSEDPRLARQTPHHEKKPPQLAKVSDGEPDTAQELVPSYDDLYG